MINENLLRVSPEMTKALKDEQRWVKKHLGINISRVEASRRIAKRAELKKNEPQWEENLGLR